MGGEFGRIQGNDMVLSEIVVTRKDFDCIRWQDVIVNSAEKECAEYSRLFCLMTKDAQASGDLEAQKAFILLGAVTSFMFRLDSKEAPLGPMGTFKNGRTVIPDDLSENHLDVFKELVDDVVDAELKARIADVLWIRKRDFRMAETAIASYAESAENLEVPHWPLCVERFERAMQLVASIKSTQHLANIVTRIESVLDRNNGEDTYFLSSRLMRLLQDYRQGDSKKYASLAEKIARRAEDAGDWIKAREYWKDKAGWHHIQNDADGERAALLSSAEALVRLSEQAVNPVSSKSSSYINASSFLREAIEAFRRIGNTKQRAEELHSILLDYQQKSLKEFKPLSAGEDISQYVAMAQSHVRGKTVHDALFSLALIGRPPKIINLRKEVEKSAKDAPLRHIFSLTMVNQMGKVVERKPSAFSKNPDDVELAKRAEMFRHASIAHQVQAICFVEPAREQINLEHNVRVDDFLTIVLNNPLVPAGREYIYAKGLHAGLMGNFLEATHLLIPQIENSLRYALSQNGVITSKLDAEGIQDEYNLNAILCEPKMASELEKVFGEDLIFDLRGLLVERFGSNLRNLLSHGLIDYGGFYSQQTVYLWWLALHLCCLPFLLANAKQNEPAAPPCTEKESGTEDAKRENANEQ